MHLYPKKFQCLLASVFLMPIASNAQLNFTFSSGKAGFQVGPSFVAFEGGSFDMFLSDGSFTPADCVLANPGGVFVAPIADFCDLGTNASILGFGDAAGISGFWSLGAVPIEAFTIEPGRDELVNIIAAPPSLLARPEISPLTDNGLLVTFDLVGGLNIDTIPISSYAHTQSFAATESERVRHDETIPHGQGSYIFGFPARLTALQAQQGVTPQNIPVSVDTPQMPESFPGVAESPLDQGFRFLNGIERVDGTMRDGVWNDGMLELDPVFVNAIEWEGIDNGINYLIGADRLRYWIQSDILDDPLAIPDGTGIVFPVANAFFPADVQPDDILLGTFSLPPFFTAGDEVVLYMRMDRNFFSGAVVRDTSFRVWGLPIRFVSTFEGFAFSALPATATDAQRLPNADFDGDGFSNFLEYAADTDPSSAASAPDADFPNLTTDLTDDGRITATVAKNPTVGGALVYSLEWSVDAVNFTPIQSVNDPIWEIEETAAELTVTARVAGEPPVAFIRARLTLTR